MQILELIEQDGYIYHKKATTHGGEFKGPCPWCGGNDRFTIWPNLDRYICRQCKKSGDAIEYLKDKKNKSYIEACQILDIKPEFKPRKNPLQEEWTPRKIKQPSLKWQEKATEFLFQSFQYLFSPFGKDHREYLNNRGLDHTALKQYRLGYNSKERYLDRESWGMLPAVNEKTGKFKKIWIPEGIVIPMLNDSGEKVIRLRIRQTHHKKSSAGKYIIVSGSNMAYMRFQYKKENPCMICEAELDAMLCDQKLGDSINLYGVGNSSARPDERSHQEMKNSEILYSLDNDKAGQIEFSWWDKHYNQVKQAFTPSGKDPGEYYENDGCLTAWGNAVAKPTKKEPDAPNFGDIDKPDFIMCDIDQKVSIINQVIGEFDHIKKTSPAPSSPEAEKKEEVKSWQPDKKCPGNNYYCNFLTHKQDTDINITRKICTLQKGCDGDSILDNPCHKQMWRLYK